MIFEINKLMNSDFNNLRQIAHMFYHNNVDHEGLTVNQSNELIELLFDLTNEIEVDLDKCIEEELENERNHTNQEISQLELEIEKLKAKVQDLESELDNQKSA